jgi:hypothetical protein
MSICLDHFGNYFELQVPFEEVISARETAKRTDNGTALKI